MKKSNSYNRGIGEKRETRRTTIILDDVLDDNLDAMALVTGIPKGELIREAIAARIEKEKGFSANKKPIVTISYA